MGFSPNGNFSIQPTLQAVIRDPNILVYYFPHAQKATDCISEFIL